jgi:mono/diheme cytochrome c family protein
MNLRPARIRSCLAFPRVCRSGMPSTVGRAGETPQPRTAGSVLYRAYGCVNCHGANGLGGVPNPHEPEKTIPPLSGEDAKTLK